jgi:hypothetical protein
LLFPGLAYLRKETCFQLILKVRIRRILEAFCSFSFRIEFYQIKSNLLNSCFVFCFNDFQAGEPSLLRTISLPSGPLYFEIL